MTRDKRDELILRAAESAVGRGDVGLISALDSDLEYHNADFDSDSFSLREWEIVDDIVRACDACGWLMSVDECMNDSQMGVVCDDCAEEEANED